LKHYTKVTKETQNNLLANATPL